MGKNCKEQDFQTIGFLCTENLIYGNTLRKLMKIGSAP